MQVNNTKIGHEIVLNMINVAKFGNLSPNLTLFTTTLFIIIFPTQLHTKKVLTFLTCHPCTFFFLAYPALLELPNSLLN